MARPAIHPGEILADEFDEVAVTPTELARQLRVPANRITQTIQGKRSVTGDSALRLGHWFGTSPQFWLDLKGAYDIRVAAHAAGKQLAKLPRLEAGEKAVGSASLTRSPSADSKHIDPLPGGTALTRRCPPDEPWSSGYDMLTRFYGPKQDISFFSVEIANQSQLTTRLG